MVEPYLSLMRPEAGGLWEFRDEGEVLSWTDGTTVAFAPELSAVLRHLASVRERIPPFPALFLLLAACRARRGGADLAEERWAELQRVLMPDEPSLRQVRDVVELVGAVRSSLELLGELPAAFWQKQEARSVVAAAAFTRLAWEHEVRLARLCLEGLEVGLPWQELVRKRDPARGALRQRHVLLEGLRELCTNLRSLRAEDLVLQLEAGVEGLPGALGEELVEELALPERPTADFLRGLCEDLELRELAVMGQQCRAGLRIPGSRLPDADAEPGGSANLSNRGPLHRLLLSELALDDATLAQRVALNEALYLDREPPLAPRPDPRCLLVDCGIRVWGRARLVGTAVAIGLAAQVHARDRVSVWHTAGSRAAESRLGDRAGLVHHLGQLDPSPRPLAALRDLLARQAARQECILITHPTVLADPIVTAGLGELAEGGLFVVTADELGALELHHFDASGHRLLRSLQLEGVVATPPRPQEAAGGRNLPAVDLLEDLPFLLPHGLHRARCVETIDGGFVLRTRDRRLMLWRGERRLGEQLLAYTPAMVLSFARTGEEIHLVTYDKKRRLVRWWIYDLEHRDLERQEILWTGACGLGLHDVAIGAHNLCLLDGEHAHVWQMGRIEPVSSVRLESGLAMYRGIGMRREGYVGVRVEAGELTLVDLGQTRPPFTGEKRSPSEVVYAEGRFGEHHTDLDRFREQFHHRASCGLLRGIQGISVIEGRDLVIHTRRRAYRVLLREERLCLQSPPHTGTESIRTTRPVGFQETHCSTVPIRFRVAVFGDGSRIFLDPRGLLHLYGSDPELPRIVLAAFPDGATEVAAATGDGRRYGSPFLMRDPNCSAAEIHALLGRFTRRLL